MSLVEPSQPAAPESIAPVAPGPLMSRNFTLLWMGQTVSQLGNQAFSIAMVFWTMKATGSASLMGLLMTLSTLPGVLLGPFGGTFADRHSRIRIAVVCDLLAGIAVAAPAVVLWLRPQATSLVIALLFGVAIVLGVIRAFFMPAIAAAIPELVPRERLAAANSLNQLSVQGSVFLGQAAGGVLYTLLGPPLLFLLDGLSYIFAAGCEGLIPRDLPRARETPVDVHPFRQFVRDTVEGFRYVWGRTGMRDFMLLASLVNFLAMPIVVLFPFYVDRYLKAGAQWYGFLTAAISVGAVAGFVLAGTLKLQGPARARGILAAMILYPVFFSALAVVRTPAVAMVVVFLGGTTVGLINVYLATMIQGSTPTELRGRVMGLLGTLGGGLVPLGLALGGVVGDLTGKNVPLVVLLCSGLALLTTLLLGLRRECREFLANG
jgi:MFS transporter, DHA3 family, macrolide efflux protein